MNPDAKCTVLLVDDHPLLLSGLRQLLEFDGGFRVVGEAANGEEALGLLQGLPPPDLVILDLKMPVLDGLETLRRLRHNGFTGKVLLYTVSDHQQDLRNALRLGADGYLLKNARPDLLLGQIRDSRAAGVMVTHSRSAAARADRVLELRADGLHDITERT